MTPIETLLAVTSLAPIALLIACIIQAAVGARIRRRTDRATRQQQYEAA